MTTFHDVSVVTGYLNEAWKCALFYKTSDSLDILWQACSTIGYYCILKCSSLTLSWEPLCVKLCRMGCNIPKCFMLWSLTSFPMYVSLSIHLSLLCIYVSTYMYVKCLESLIGMQLLWPQSKVTGTLNTRIALFISMRTCYKSGFWFAA